MTTLPKISLHQQTLGVIEAARTQARADHTEHRRGKMRLTAVEYRQSILLAAHTTLSMLDRERDRLPVTPAQVDLYRAWQKIADENVGTVFTDPDAPVRTVSASEAVALARLLSNLAALALRADLKG